MLTAAILTAAGSGNRLGADVPKALVAIDGLPLFLHAARRLSASESVQQIVITTPPGYGPLLAEACLSDPAVTVPVRVVDGGATRQASVAAGLAVLPPEVDVVLVHDAARPFASPQLMDDVTSAVRAGHPAVIPGLEVTDTVKEIGPDGVGVQTPDRVSLRAVQTPQGFSRAVLERAHAAADADSATDDAALVEALGEPVLIIPGEEGALKITTPLDLVTANYLVGAR